MVMLTSKPEQIDVDFNKTAVIVVDMQNAFAAKGGMFDLAGFDISAAADVIQVNRRLLETARTNGVKVIYLQMTYQPDLSDAGNSSSPNYHKELGMILMRDRPELDGKLLIENTWDWQIVDELAPQEGDYVITKSRYSGFVGTNLNSYLRGLGIQHVLFTGVATNVCVDSTARDAYFNEYWPILIEDAMNHSGPDFNRESTLWNFENVFGWVSNSDHVIEAMERDTN
jgi:ureidoacrylate peracid hydrolase